MSIERQTLSALKWASFAKATSQVIGWAVTLVVLRLLHPEDYGLMALVSVVIAVFGNVAELGIGAAVIQAPDISREELAQVSGLVTLVNLAVFALVVAGAPLLAAAYDETALATLVQVAALQFPISSLATLPQALAQRDLDFRRLAWVEMAAVVVSSLLTLALAWYGAGVWALVAGGLSLATVRTLMLLRHGFVRPSFRLAGARRFLPVGGAVMFGRLTWQVVYQSDVLIGARRLGPDAIGLYSVALHLATLPMQKIMTVLNQVALPAAAKMQDDMQLLGRRMVAASRLLTVFSVPVLWGMSAIAPELVAAVLGPRWAGAVFPLQAISLVVPLRMINATFSTAAIGVGQAATDFRNNLAIAVVLPAAFYVGSSWGVDGLAASWLVAIPLLFLLNFHRLARAVSVDVKDLARAIWRPAVAGAAMYLAVSAARLPLADLAALARLPLLVGVGAVAYLAVLQPLDPGVRRDLLALWRTARS